MPERRARGFPLFLLGMVALPTESVPLHRQFGIVWLPDRELKPIGCACEVEQVLERMEGGRMNILARGRAPFRLLSRQEDLPYPAGMIEFVEETEEEVDREAASAAHDLNRELVELATDRVLGEDELTQMDAYRMAATVEFDEEAKQELLELRSENARLRLLALQLQMAIERLDLLEHAQARARSNGKVRFR